MAVSPAAENARTQSSGLDCDASPGGWAAALLGRETALLRAIT